MTAFAQSVLLVALLVAYSAMMKDTFQLINRVHSRLQANSKSRLASSKKMLACEKLLKKSLGTRKPSCKI
jgi:hypothetical protein